jgi:4-amino-4-deoxy-L-arabinose transferase-like glycosyltransferase
MVSRKKDYAILALIIAIGIFIRVLHWSPSPDGDEARYINHAVALSQGSTPRYFDGAVAVRIPYLAFLTVWGYAFGFATTSLQASGLFLYAVLALLLYELARRLYDSRVAVTSVMLLSLFPIHILLSTHALTDDLGLIFALGATLLWIYSWNLPGPKPQAVLWILAGFSAGLATGIRQPFFLLGVILPIGSIAQGRSWMRTILATFVFALGAAFYFFLESVAFWAWLGDHVLPHSVQ